MLQWNPGVRCQIQKWREKLKNIGIFGNAVRLGPDSRENTGNIIHAHAALSMFSAAESINPSVDDANIEKIRAQNSHLAYAAATVLQVNSTTPWIDKLTELADFIEKAGLPVVTFGFGHSSKNREFALRDAKVDHRSVHLLRVLADHSETLAVRGELTADLCEKVGIKNVSVIGCQSLYSAASKNKSLDWQHRDITGKSVTSITGGLDYTDQMAFCIRNNVDLIGQDEFSEHKISRGILPLNEFKGEGGAYVLPDSIRKGLNPGAVSLDDYYHYCLVHFHKFFNVETWSSHIKKNYDFAFGTRFHGNVAALQAGVPALWLTHDTRTVELCRHFRLPSIKAQDFWAYRTIDELKEVTDFTAFENRLPKLIGEFLHYLERNGVGGALKTEFVEGLEAWRK